MIQTTWYVYTRDLLDWFLCRECQIMHPRDSYRSLISSFEISVSYYLLRTYHILYWRVSSLVSIPDGNTVNFGDNAGLRGRHILQVLGSGMLVFSFTLPQTTLIILKFQSFTNPPRNQLCHISENGRIEIYPLLGCRTKPISIWSFGVRCGRRHDPPLVMQDGEHRPSATLQKSRLFLRFLQI